ncbi:hypothetical protein D3C86_1810270 [compost metagenome]
MSRTITTSWPSTTLVVDRSRWKISLTFTSGNANAWLPSMTISVGMIARVNGTLMTIFEPWPLAE